VVCGVCFFAVRNYCYEVGLRDYLQDDEKIRKMLTQLECASCIVDDLRGALQILSLGEEIEMKILREAFSFLAHEFSRDKTPSYFITGVHRILKSISGINTPDWFKNRRKSS